MLAQLLILAAAVTAADPMDDTHMLREGAGEHRAAMDAAELTPFDAGLFSSLTDWRNGEAPALDGGVLAIVFWSNDDPASVRAVVPTLKRLEMSYGGEGLTTLAVHRGDDWEGALERIESGLIGTPTARDAEGAFAAALGADDVPDVFVIDRAGQMRFADIDQRQLPTAVRGLIGETREEAQSAGERRAAASAESEARAEKEAAKTAERDTRRAAELEKLPPKPDASAYAAAAWPEHNAPEDPKDLYARNAQGKPLPVPFGVNEKWLSEEAPTEGRVIVLDFWATWCGPCVRASPMLDTLQKKHIDDLRVVGVAGQREDERTIRAYMDKHKVAYSHVIDQKQSVYRSLQVTAIPHVIVLSTDGVVRWQGLPGPAFSQAVEQVLATDPWVKARRDAE